MTLMEKQRALIDRINGAGDALDQYNLLLCESALLPPLPEERHNADTLVKGCLSRVWLDMRVEDGVFFLEADSDALILKGILSLLRSLLNGMPAVEVAETELTLLTETELAVTFTSDRRAGMREVMRRIREGAG